MRALTAQRTRYMTLGAITVKGALRASHVMPRLAPLSAIPRARIVFASATGLDGWS